MTAKLVRWDTPFANATCPSVIVFVNREPQNPYAYPVEVIVSPSGLEKYPKFRIQFGESVAFSAMEEMHFPDSQFVDVEIDGEASCSYRFVDSPWLEGYKHGEYFLFNEHGKNDEALSHYVIFGGDDVVQVVTKYEPAISVIDKPTTLRIDFSV